MAKWQCGSFLWNRLFASKFYPQYVSVGVTLFHQDNKWEKKSRHIWMDVAVKTQVSPHCLFISLQILTSERIHVYILRIHEHTSVALMAGVDTQILWRQWIGGLAVCNCCNTSAMERKREQICLAFFCGCVLSLIVSQNRWYTYECWMYDSIR